VARKGYGEGQEGVSWEGGGERRRRKRNILAP